MSNYCILPFIHLQIKPNGQVKPCCRFDINDPSFDFSKENINNKSLTEIYSSDTWNKLRNNLNNNEYVQGCNACDVEEKLLYKTSSLRYSSNRMFIKENTNAIKYLEIGFGNFCNLKCRTCNSYLSTTWIEDDKLLSKYNRKSNEIMNIDYDFSYEDLKDLIYIKFTGGETLIHPNFKKLLLKLKEYDLLKNITIELYTNCTFFPKKDLLDLINEFKNVRIYFSIDGYGKINEYIRSPSKWEDVENNVKKWFENKQNKDYVMISTINLYNIMHVEELIKWWTDLSIFYNNKNLYFYDEMEDENKGNGRFIFSILKQPEYLSINNLNRDQRKIILENIKNIIIKNGLVEKNLNKDEKFFSSVALFKLQQYLKKENYTNNFDQFKDFTYDLNKIRNENYLPDILKL